MRLRMALRTTLFLSLTVLLVPFTLAQGPEPPSRPAAADGILLNFQDTSVDAVLEYLSEAAGFVVVKDAPIEGRITIMSRQTLNAEETVTLLNTVLKEKGYAAIRAGRTLKIVPLDEAKKSNVPVQSGNDPSAITPSDRLVTQIIPLRFVDAVRLKADIASLIPEYADLAANASSNALILTDTEANVRRVVEIVRALDTSVSAVADIRVVQLKYANATNAAKLINELFSQEEATQQQQGRQQPAFRRFRAPGDQADAGEENPRTQRITASSDDRTNAVVVSGPPDVLDVVEKVLHDLDSNPTAEQAVFIYHVKNAKAANLETVLNNLFTQRQTTAGGRDQGQTQGAGRGGFAQLMSQLPTAASQSASDLVGQVYVVADADSNSLMVMTASKNFDAVRSIVTELDKAVPQVLIKVLIAEVTYDNKLDLGVEFSVLNLNNNGSKIFTDFGVAAQTGGLIFKLVEDDVTVALRALQTVGKLDVLSRPYILASDNQPSNITVGQEVPFIQNTRTTETGQTINTIQYEDIGIILNVTPHINPDGVVIMDVAPEISALTGDTVAISETVSAPVFAKRSATGRVAIRDGQTIVIGGLMEDKKTDNVRKVPLLGDIPLLGALFRRTITQTTKTELLIFLTPHVAQEAAALKPMLEDELAGARLVPGAVSPGTFQEHLKGLQRGAAQYQDKNDRSKP